MNKIWMTTAMLGLGFLLSVGPSAFAQPPGFPGGDRGGSSRGSTDRGGTTTRSTATTASSVVAVADERSNSVVVSAPEELLPMVEQLIKEIDSIIQRTPDVQVFFLRFADAEEMASLVEDMFDEQASGFSRFGGSSSSRTATTMIRTTAEFDERTNSVVVSADRDKMPLIAQMIQTLDQDPARDQKVFIYDLKNANPESVSTILQEIIDQNQGGGRSSGSSNRSSSSPFSQRSPTSQQGGGFSGSNFGGSSFGGSSTGR